MLNKLNKLLRGGNRGRAGRVSGPVVLAVLDGWGEAPPGPTNAITGQSPNIDRLRSNYPQALVKAHGLDVGLLDGQEGNSEAGHGNIGAGRIVAQDILYVSDSIEDGTFFKNTALKDAVEHARQNGSRIHLMGLMSNGNSAHASPRHLYALLDMMRREGQREVRLHLFTDGRDSSPHSAPKLLAELRQHMSEGQQIATIMGRFYAMDRNKWWVRTEHAYDAIVCGHGLAAHSAEEAIQQGYDRDETDEFILPAVIVGDDDRPAGEIRDGDAIIFFNLRSDRARQLAKTFVQENFSERNEGSFERGCLPQNIRFVAMTDFGPDLDGIRTAYPSRDIKMGLTETLGRHGLRQLYIAESEKYAHVTYFMNGGYAQARFGEERIRIPSQFVAHHYLRPEMRADVITDEVIRRLAAGKVDFVALNYANADMVAHSGEVEPTRQAVRCVDRCLGRLAERVLASHGTLFIVGDHGNAEQMFVPETGEVITEHSTNPVPFVVVGGDVRGRRLRNGRLADVAPTILRAMGLPQPVEMTGRPLWED